MIESRGEDEDDEHLLRERDRDRWSGYVQVDPDTMKRITGFGIKAGSLLGSSRVRTRMHGKEHS